MTTVEPKSKEAELKAKCKEVAMASAAGAVDASWNDVWKARKRVVAEGKEEYSASVKLTIKNLGDGKANIGAVASWAENHKLTIQDKEVSVHPELFDTDKGEGGNK